MKVFRVYGQKVPSYDYPSVREAVFALLNTLSLQLFPGMRVLVKPNLVTFRQAHLSCTNVNVVIAVCAYLKAKGAHPIVGDSPAFGSLKQVAKSCGLAPRLEELGVPLVPFREKVKVRLPCGVKVGLAREALSVDGIINLPKFKAHNQLLLTLAVKNLFGCVVGLEKPWLHASIGDKDDLFAQMLFEVAQTLPVIANLMDAVEAMEGRGPTGGKRVRLSFLAAAQDPVAMDTTLYQSLGLEPALVPLWRVAQRADHPAAFPENVKAAGIPPLPAFKLPKRLTPITFNPLRLMKGLLKRLVLRLSGSYSGGTKS